MKILARDDQAFAGHDHPAAVLPADRVDPADARHRIAGIYLVYPPVYSAPTLDQGAALGDVKPGSLMLRRAIEKFNIDPARSFIVGDSAVDIAAGRAEGVPGVFLGGFKCETCRLLDGEKPDLILADIVTFASFLEKGAGK